MNDSKRRRAEYADITKTAIINSGLGLFEERGYEATSLDDVCAVGRVSKGGLYHHFANKRMLFAAVLAETSALFVARIDAAIAGHRGTVDLPFVLGAYLDAAADPTFAKLVLREGPGALGWDGWRQFSQDQISAPFVRILMTHCTDELGPQGPSELVLQTLVAGLNEMAVAILDSPDTALARQEATGLITALVESFRARGDSPV